MICRRAMPGQACRWNSLPSWKESHWQYFPQTCTSNPYMVTTSKPILRRTGTWSTGACTSVQASTGPGLRPEAHTVALWTRQQ